FQVQTGNIGKATTAQVLVAVKCNGQTVFNTNQAPGILASKPSPGSPPPPTPKSTINWGNVKSATLNSDGTQLTVTFDTGGSTVFYNQDPKSSKTYKPHPDNVTLDNVAVV